MVTDVTEYNLDVVEIQKAWLPDEDKHEEGDYVFNRGKGNKDYSFRTECLVKKCLKTAVKKVQFITDRKPYLRHSGSVFRF